MGRPARGRGPRRAVFLDRDGTLLDEGAGVVTVPGAVRLLPGAARAVARLREAGFLVVVVTNQAAVARGLLTEEGLAEIHGRMAREGVKADAVLYCPHLDTAEGGVVPAYARTCECRKPLPGLLRRADEAVGPIDYGVSFMVGDSARDLEAGRAAGVRTVLVLTGKGRQTLAALGAAGTPRRPDHVAADVDEAAAWCVAQEV
ncbi:MAG: HAD-IIIA family hydrolase [Planctomycetes bacterium]|nr:HAD-IIIA family hydrolase [Planctomycetota bacterium]